jgi:methyl-accepting chemotaxis protein
MVDRQTDGIAQSTSLVQQSVDRMKSGLDAFAADARANGGQLQEAHERLGRLEALSNEMLDRLASSGVAIDDTPFIQFAQTSMREIKAVIEAGIGRAEISEADVFDFDYRPDARHRSRCNMKSASATSPTATCGRCSIASCPRSRG